jgi:Concanavalin A-like lectin/glucanases superfamily
MTFLPKTIRTLLLIVLSYFFVQNLYAQNASINFDGVDDYIQTNVPPIAGGAARTIEAWIKTTANADPNNGGLQNVIVDMGTMATGSRFTFNVLFNNAIRLEVQGNGLSGTIPVNDGLWHHVAGVYNPLATNKVILYVDGVLDVTGNFTVTANTSATGDVTIGRRVDGINRFKGNIDEVRIWSVAKTQAELIASMNKELCNAVPSLYSYFTFNDGIPSGNNTNAVTYDLTSAHKIGTFINFNLTGANSNYAAEKILSAGMTVKNINLTACSTYTWPASGLSYNTAGTYFARSLKGNGCDSIMKLNLSISTIINTSDSVNTCDTFIWSLNGLQYANSGVYVDTVVTSGGCDSIVTLVLNVGVIPPTTQKINACDTYTWNANGITYSNSILTSYSFTNSRGCDSVVYLDLTINKSSNGTQNITNCDKYTWPANGQTYTNSGQYFVTLNTYKGCDSNLTLNLTLNNSYKIIDFVNTCVEYTWAQNGKKYTDNVRDSVVFPQAAFYYLLNLQAARTNG